MGFDVRRREGAELYALAMAGGGKIRFPSKDTCEKAYRQFEDGDRSYRQDGWESQLRLLDRADPSWRH